MRIGDEESLAAVVRETRRRRGLSQAELAEVARVSTKTVQRLEAGEPIAGSSRRAVLTAIGVDPDNLGTPETDRADPGVAPWTRAEDAKTLWRSLAGARSVDVDLDRDAWRQALREGPWYKRDAFFVLASEDPVDRILEIVDRATRSNELPPGRAAKQQNELAEAMRAAEAMRWSLATRVDESDLLSLYIGPPSVVEQRVGVRVRSS